MSSSNLYKDDNDSTMRQTSVKERANESRASFHAAYRKLIERIAIIKDHEAAVVDAIRAFYVIVEREGLTLETETSIVAMDKTERWDLLCKLVIEVINRDLCVYVSTGINPKYANTYNTRLQEIINENKYKD